LCYSFFVAPNFQHQIKWTGIVYFGSWSRRHNLPYYFKQTHIVPDGIDLDQMSSSFSADGVLVVKAPKKK